jgi:polygalacturonase
LLFGLLSIQTVSAAVAWTYNVRDFGATGDGKTKDTGAFQKALDTCAVAGGGEVVVPAGRYLIGSVQIGQRTLLRLEKDSVIVGSPDLDDYPLVDIRWEGRWMRGHRSLICAMDVDHVGIVGPGTLEGDETVAASNREPRGALVLEMISCRNIRWEGFTVKQPGNNWATHPTYCSNVVIENLNITGRRDGIDVDSCRDVRIVGCTIDSGDDCISLKSGRGLNGARLGNPTEDVLIANCTLHGRRFACLGIGSEASAGIKNVRIEHCDLTAYSDAFYIKSRIGRAGAIENFVADDIDVHTGGFLRINLVSAGNKTTADDPVEGLLGYPSGRNFRFTNVRLHDVRDTVRTSLAPEKPLDGLWLENVSGTCKSGITLQHVRDAVLRNVAISGFTGPRLAIDDVTGEGLDGAEKYVAPAVAPATAPAGKK